MMIKAVYGAKQMSAEDKNPTAENLGKVVYILDIDTASKYATIAYPVNEDECQFKIVGLGALRIIDENLTKLYFSVPPFLKSLKAPLQVKSVYEDGAKTVKANGTVKGNSAK